MWTEVCNMIDRLLAALGRLWTEPCYVDEEFWRQARSLRRRD